MKPLIPYILILLAMTACNKNTETTTTFVITSDAAKQTMLSNYQNLMRVLTIDRI
jgi:hypothetical protein